MSAPGSGPHTLGPTPRASPGDLRGPSLCLHKGLGSQDARVKPDECGQSAGGRSRNRLRPEGPDYIVLPKRASRCALEEGGIWVLGLEGGVARIGVHRLGQEPQMM